jgi:hypothetical protein
LDEGNTFSNNTEYGINMYNGGSLNMWCDAQLTSPTTISSNTKGPIRVDEGGSALLSNLTLASQSKGIRIQNGNFVKLENVTITGSGEYGIYVEGTNIGLEHTTISGSTDVEIRAQYYSTIKLDNTTITGTADSNEIDLRYGSILTLGSNSSVTGTVTCGNTAPDNGTFVNDSGTSVTTSGC